VCGAGGLTELRREPRVIRRLGDVGAGGDLLQCRPRCVDGGGARPVRSE
jgi:hypothetical protein